jgi:hypothetical protein
MADYLLASAVIFVVLAAWQAIEYGYRRFARRHPGLGPYRPEQGCGDCACGQGSCTATDGPLSTTHTVTRATPAGAQRACTGSDA